MNTYKNIFNFFNLKILGRPSFIAKSSLYSFFFLFLLISISIFSLSTASALTLSNGDGSTVTHIEKSGYESNADVKFISIPEKVEPESWWDGLLQFLKIEPKQYKEVKIVSVSYDAPAYNIKTNEKIEVKDYEDILASVKPKLGEKELPKKEDVKELPIEIPVYKNVQIGTKDIPVSSTAERTLVKAPENRDEKKFEENDTYVYYYKFDPAKDLPLKIGNNSIYIYTTTSSSSIFTNTQFEPNNATHLEINNDSTNPPYDSLVGYWSFDADTSTTAYDLTNQNNDGTYTSGAVVTSGQYGDAVDLDGINDYINVPYVSGMNSNYFGVSAWVKIKSDGANNPNMLIDKQLSGSGWRLTYDENNDNFNCDVWTTAGTSNSAGTTINQNQWYHVTCLYNGTQSELYINGIKNATGGVSAGAVTYSAGNAPIRIGEYGGGTGYTPNATIDEVMFFNNYINSSQILDIYNNQSNRFKSSGTQTFLQQNITPNGNNTANCTINSQQLFSSNLQCRLGYWDGSKGYNNTMDGLVGYWHADGNAEDVLGINNGTLTDGANANYSAVYNNGFSFDGVNDYVNISDNNILDLTRFVSINLWVKPNNVNQTSPMIMKRTPGSSVNANYQIWMIGDDLISEFIVYPSSTKSKTVANVLNTDWQMITVIYDWEGNKVYIYRNGVLILDDTETSDAGADTNPLILGYYSPKYKFNGSMDEVMIFNTTLTSKEVKELYINGRANWQYTNYSNFVGDTAIGISYPSSTTNLKPEIKFTSGTNNFYTPFTIGNLNLTDYYTSGITYPPYIEFLIPPTTNGSQPQGQNWIYANLSIVNGTTPITTNITLWNMTSIVSSTTSLIYNFTSLPYTNYTLTASASNVNNVTYATNVSIELNGDGTPPELTITSPQNQTYSSTNIQINGSCTDNIGVTGLQYSYEGGAWTNFTFNTTISTIGYEVYHDISFNCSDAFANSIIVNRRVYVGSTYVAPNETDPIWNANWSIINNLNCTYALGWNNTANNWYCTNLTGPQGPTGDTGPQGPQGIAGINGTSGVSTRCLYKRYGYYNLNLPWYGERGCV